MLWGAGQISLTCNKLKNFKQQRFFFVQIFIFLVYTYDYYRKKKLYLSLWGNTSSSSNSSNNNNFNNTKNSFQSLKKVNFLTSFFFFIWWSAICIARTFVRTWRRGLCCFLNKSSFGVLKKISKIRPFYRKRWRLIDPMHHTFCPSP